jgi:hypothetical protein
VQGKHRFLTEYNEFILTPSFSSVKLGGCTLFLHCSAASTLAKETVGCVAGASDSADGIKLFTTKSGGVSGKDGSLAPDKLVPFDGSSIGS